MVRRKIRPMPDKVIILAMGEGRKFCDFDGEVWSCNRGYRQIAELQGHVERLFLAHDSFTKYEDKSKVFDWDEINKLADLGVEVWNTHRVKKLKHKLYPVDSVIKKFKCDYISNTLSYMIIFAIDQWTKIKDGRVVLKDKNPKKMVIYGADMTTMGEYQLEKASMEYWIGYARGLGIEVEIGGHSCLCMTHTGRPYGQTFYNVKDIDPFGLLKSKRKTIRATEVDDITMAQLAMQKSDMLTSKELEKRQNG